MILNMSGGGPGLNFDIVGGTSAPSSPKRNTIWVNTSTAITGYMFSTTRPSSPIPGVVWIVVGNSSSAVFNALKKEYLMVYPVAAEQYINNAWVSKDASLYTGSKWIDLWNGELYKPGNQYETYTGGWSKNGYSWTITTTYSMNNPTFTTNGMCFDLPQSSGEYAAISGSQKKVNLSKHSYIEVTLTNCKDAHIYYCIHTSKSVWHDVGVVRGVLNKDGVSRIDVSALNGEFYICFFHFDSSVLKKGTISGVKMV